MIFSYSVSLSRSRSAVKRDFHIERTCIWSTWLTEQPFDLILLVFFKSKVRVGYRRGTYICWWDMCIYDEVYVFYLRTRNSIYWILYVCTSRHCIYSNYILRLVYNYIFFLLTDNLKWWVQLILLSIDGMYNSVIVYLLHK